MSICRSVNRKRFDECFRQVSNKEARRKHPASTGRFDSVYPAGLRCSADACDGKCGPELFGANEEERTNHDSRRRLSRDCNHPPHDG